MQENVLQYFDQEGYSYFENKAGVYYSILITEGYSYLENDAGLMYAGPIEHGR